MPMSQELYSQIVQANSGAFSALSKDAIKHWIWDTRAFTTTYSDYTYFNQPIGATFKTNFLKTSNETNMQSTGQMPNGQLFLATKIGVALISYMAAAATAAQTYIQAFYNLVQSSYFELKIAGREFECQMPGRLFLPSVAMSAITLTTINSARTGDFIASGWVDLQPTPVPLQDANGTPVTFSVVQHQGNPDTSVQTILNANAALLAGIYSVMQVTLEGLLIRKK